MSRRKEPLTAEQLSLTFNNDEAMNEDKQLMDEVYNKVVDFLDDIHNKNVCDSIVHLIEAELADNWNLLGGTSLIDYIKDGLENGRGLEKDKELGIFVRGNRCLYAKDTDNIFSRLKKLKSKLSSMGQENNPRTTPELPQIDCIMTDKEISKWHDRWSVSRFGNDCLNPARYYKTTEDGRYLYGVKHGTINEEKAIRERVLELLCRINSINKELYGEGLTKHLTFNEREIKIKERGKLFEEFLSLTQTQPEAEITTATEPQPEQMITKPTRGRGRPKETLKDKMINDADGKKLQRLHEIWGGRKGKDAALIIVACIKTGWMSKPTYTQVKDEFGDIGHKSGYNKYIDEKKFTDEEIEGAKNNLR